MTKDYLNLNGLSYFLNKLLVKFATKDELKAVQENVITDDEIDEICETSVVMASEVMF